LATIIGGSAAYKASAGGRVLAAGNRNSELPLNVEFP